MSWHFQLSWEREREREKRESKRKKKFSTALCKFFSYLWHSMFHGTYSISTQLNCVNKKYIIPVILGLFFCVFQQEVSNTLVSHAKGALYKLAEVWPVFSCSVSVGWGCGSTYTYQYMFWGTDKQCFVTVYLHCLCVIWRLSLKVDKCFEHELVVLVPMNGSVTALSMQSTGELLKIQKLSRAICVCLFHENVAFIKFLLENYIYKI